MAKLITAIMILFMVLPSVYASEIQEMRTYNQKVFDGPQGTKQYRIHAKQIHYKDEDGKFQDVDTTIRPVSGGWKQDKASFQSEFPTHADELFKFNNRYEGADHFVNMIPQAAHVKGEVFNGKDGNYVLYPDAFGAGIDLNVYAYHGGLKEVIVIKEKPSPNTDLSFSFEIQMDSKLKVKEQNGEEWDKNSELDFKKKTLVLEADGKASYFKQAVVWDSSPKKKIQPVDISFSKHSGKLILTKIVTAEFMENATFPVMTDHATSYYSGAGEGTVSNNSGFVTWDSIHDATDADTLVTGSIGGESSVAALSYLLYRGFGVFNTSGISDTDTVTSTVLNMVGFFKEDDLNDSVSYITIVGPTTQANQASLATADYDQCASVDSPQELIDSGERKDITGIDVGGSTYTQFTFNATGISTISKTGNTLVGVREGHDATDTTAGITTNKFSDAHFYSSEETGSSADPFLDITTTSPSGSGVVGEGVTFLGIRLT